MPSVSIKYLTLALLQLLPLSAQSETLRIGSIAGEYVAEVAKFKPLTNHLSTRLSTHGIDEIEMVITSSMEQMAQKLKQGTVDLFIDSPYPAIVVSQLSGSRMALRRWKKGVAAYHSVIFVRKEQPINSIKELQGMRIAFEEPFSTASYFLGKSELIKNGLQPLELPNDSSAPNRVGYRFSGSDNTTVTWVLRKRIEAGIINHHKFDQLKPKIREQFKIIHSSPAVPRHIVSFRADLPQQTVSAITAALTSMDQSPDGRAALQAFQATHKFDPIPPADQNNLNQLKEMANPLN